MDKTCFDVLGLMPADLAHPGIAVAVARCGGVGVLDLAFVSDAVQASRNFRRLLDAGETRIGLRVVAGQAPLARELIDSAGSRALTVILSGAASDFAALRAAAGVRAHDRCLAEVLAVDDVELAEATCDGMVARGHEAGGPGAEDSSYILLQKLLGRVGKAPTKPIYVQGGIGVHTAAACRAAGAAGVVLDDALLLLAESALPARLQDELARLNGAECRSFGDPGRGALRLYGRPGGATLKTADAAARRLEAGGNLADFQRELQAQVGWLIDDRLLPLGQGIGIAAAYRERYGSVPRLLQALRRAALRQPEQAAQLAFLGENGPLAASHGTRYPLVQGPMTRVSDDPRFAFEVAQAGALPFLALALLRGPQVAELLAQTRELMGTRPWGVGLLGFVSQELRDEQCAEIWKCAPPYALIAGGRPDQAAEFERRGITTYLHAPAPALLKMYLQQGARRFVFEGRECGGHIGPLSSFALWEQCIDVLLTEVAAAQAADVHVLFAGGVHDALSGAMLAAMTAPLAARGIKVGALMGTAYLFTQEIVASGAVVDDFQQEALRCRRTVSLESGPGHVTRCVDTPFAAQFAEARRRMSRDGLDVDAMRSALEDLNLGRLRLASKGRKRGASGALVTVPRDEQLRDGLYMIGQVATLRDHVLPMQSLHEDVCNGALALLAAQRPVEERAEQPADIAIVGIGLALPGANDAADYWQMILERRSVLREVPAERWDAELFYDADPKARDKVYSKWGGFLDEIAFDPVRFGIPPRSMKSIDPMQLLALECAARTLADAGYADGGFDRERTSVILGASGGAGDLGVQYAMRAELPRFVEDLSPEVWERLPEWTEESFAGTLLNVAAGRIANRLDLGGVNFTVDAACGSSLAAIKLAVDELESGRSAMVLAGGFDTTQSIFAFTAFSKTQALSARGEPRTFDQSTDGIAISEGVAMVALKRLADAQAAGDRIYAVIKGAAGSSDGRALGLTAPRIEGQVRALRRAYAKAGFSPATLGLVEAHGTGTIVGDRTEAQTVAQTLADAHAAPQSVALGSVKTLLGHTKAAAGIAGLVKVALALHHRVLPGHLGVERPIEPLADARAPLYLLKDPQPWFAPAQHPRRGAVSAFGFGGTNFHAVLEEHAASMGRTDGAQRWPAELFVFRAPDVTTLIRDLEQLAANVRPGSRVDPGALAALLAITAQQRGRQPVALTIVARDLTALAKDIDATLAHLRQGNALPPGVRYSAQVPAQAPALAFVFPGQGAQHVNMGRETALYIDELRQAVERADRVLGAGFDGVALSRRIYPAAAFDVATETAQIAALTDTRVAQPAIGALALGFLRLAERLGLHAQAAAGHSYGEYAALLAAGAIEADDFLRLSAVRGRAMATASASTIPGGMAAIHAARERVQALLADFPTLRVANHNAPEQCVISGPRVALDEALPRIEAAGLRCTRLPVSGAFHTELVAPARAPLSQAIHATRFATPRLPVYANSNAAPYPDEPAVMQALLDEHLLSSVEFVASVEAMYAAGCRVFLELGPRGIVSGMVRQTLAGRDALAITLDGGGLRGLLGGLAELFVAGVDLDLTQLHTPRELPALTPARLAELGRPLQLPRHTWMLSGGGARPIDDPVHRSGAKPALTQATAAAARAQRSPAPTQAAAAPLATAPIASQPLASGALAQEALIAYQQTMRQFLSLQERVMQQILGGAPAPASATPLPPISIPVAIPAAASFAAVPQSTAPAPISTTTTAPVPTAAPTPFDARATLLNIVAERTGYPTEMLRLDADLEADLGIDSIKRVEIIGALQAAMPDALAQALRQKIERYTKARTLATILAELDAAAPVEAAKALAISVAAPIAAFDARMSLLNIVAERTGYPTEMLRLDADLEADLGIDSIKRVEIIGALQAAVPDALAQTLRQNMDRYTKARTLAAILAELDAAAPITVVQTPAVAATSPAAAFDARATLLNIVAERTGYPTEMLRLDADLEADLGIDSIKRVEIIGALQAAVPDALAQTLRQNMDRYTKARTLAAILAELDKATPATAAVAPATVKAAKAVEAPLADAPTPRYVIRSRATPLPPQTQTLSGLALLLGGPESIALPLQQSLQSRGMRPLRITVTDPAALRDAVAAAQHAHGPVQALLHLTGLEPSRPYDLAAWRNAWQRDTMGLFHALQALGGELASVRVLAASRLGGSMGRDAIGRGSATGGGANGLFNCLRQEYPRARLRAVDFDGQDDAEIAQRLAEELASNCAEPEVGYVGGQRLGYVTADQPLTASPFPAVPLTPASNWVMLVTGGARGITAQIVAELVRPGMRVVLLGRSALPGAEAAETAALVDAAQLKPVLLKQRLARGETPRPVDIDRDVARILADREIRANVAQLADAGALVEYVACDVRDDDALRTLIADLYAKYGNIDAVLHGAGVIEDKLFADKSADSFERVLGTKIDAAFVLAQHLRPQNLKLMAFFTSVAGRYGNRGQGDYAAANETLNRLAWQLHREWPQTRVIAINWGPWDAGMASEAVRRALRERGIEAIPVGAGRRFFIDEIMYGPRHDVEIVAGAGPWSNLVEAERGSAADAPGADQALKRA